MLNDWLPYFPEIQELSKKGKDVKVHCPFHADSTPSLSVDIDRNLAHCFGCGWSGNFVKFETDIKGFDLISLIEERKADVDRAKKKGQSSKSPFLSREDIKRFQKNLESSTKFLDLLREKRLLDTSTIEKYQLGFERERIIIPILDPEGRAVNFRKYSFRSKDKYISVKDHGETRIFPIENLLKDDILFLEGEMDTLLGNQLGYNAVTLTTGAATRIPDRYLPFFRGKTVSICYDLDEAGEKGAAKLKNALSLFAKEIRIIPLPKDLGKGGDFTDFFLKDHPKEEFDALMHEHVEEIDLEDLSDDKYWNQKVAVTAKISGKTMVPYLVPKRIRLKCHRNQGKTCSTCLLLTGDFELEFFPSNPIYLELIENPKEKIDRLLRTQIPIPKKCKIEVEKLEFQNVESLRLLPSDLFSTSGEYITRQVYFIGSGIRANTVCRLQGIVIPEPKLQFSTFMIEKAEQKAGVLDLFQRSRDLKIFQSDDIAGKLMEIYRDFESNVTLIFGRSEILQVLDFVYFSPITFRFAGKYVPKGWTEALIIGDSRQGKSETIRGMLKHYGVGAYCGSESASIAGLKGGVAQVGRQWQLQWGLLPLNHRSIVIIDDFQKMDKAVISSLSRIRSEGIAEIIKIESQQALAQTRLVWISNPIGDRTLSTYSFGIEAVAELVEQPSDIARFDLVVCVQEGEVDMSKIPLYLREKREHIYTSALNKELLLWNWTRLPEQIVFEPETEEVIFQVSTEILKKYQSPIPIVKSGEQHIVTAKLAVAIAGRLYSTDVTQEKIIVLPRHVRYVQKFLEDIWDSQSCLYNEFAFLKRTENQIEDEEAVQEAIEQTNRKKIIEDLLRYPSFLVSDFEDLLATDRATVKLFLSTLVQNRALRRKRGWYEKTPAFIQLLRRMQQRANGAPPF
jgi:hypothetical protein